MKTDALAAALKADILRTDRPATPTNITNCFACGGSYIYKGPNGENSGRFCSEKCREAYDAGYRRPALPAVKYGRLTAPSVSTGCPATQSGLPELGWKTLSLEVMHACGTFATMPCRQPRGCRGGGGQVNEENCAACWSTGAGRALPRSRRFSTRPRRMPKQRGSIRRSCSPRDSSPTCSHSPARCRAPATRPRTEAHGSPA
jgi:hypothetical protein